jgi:Protein of unknown function (DUF3237)
MRARALLIAEQYLLAFLSESRVCLRPNQEQKEFEDLGSRPCQGRDMLSPGAGGISHHHYTGVTDYGVTLDAILSGKEKVPLQGTRFDVAFEGRAKGRVSGKVRGIDYMLMRADGRADLDLRAIIETDDGHRIAMHIDGIVSPRANEPIVDLRENVRLTTAAPSYAWVNTRLVWGVGTANLATGKVHVEGYMQ